MRRFSERLEEQSVRIKGGPSRLKLGLALVDTPRGGPRETSFALDGMSGKTAFLDSASRIDMRGHDWWFIRCDSSNVGAFQAIYNTQTRKGVCYPLCCREPWICSLQEPIAEKHDYEMVDPRRRDELEVSLEDALDRAQRQLVVSGEKEGREAVNRLDAVRHPGPIPVGDLIIFPQWMDVPDRPKGFRWSQKVGWHESDVPDIITGNCWLVRPWGKTN